jgi:hypothetical protein
VVLAIINQLALQSTQVEPLAVIQVAVIQVAVIQVAIIQVAVIRSTDILLTKRRPWNSLDGGLALQPI